MKKVFMVELEYQEAERNKNAPVVYDTSLEMAIENYLEGFVQTENISKEYVLKVKEVTA